MRRNRFSASIRDAIGHSLNVCIAKEIKMQTPYPRLILAAFLALLLAACDNGNNTLADGSIGGTGVVAFGSISGFGSVFVNGVEFRLSSATRITIDGSPNQRQTDLNLGTEVAVKGRLDASGVSGTASSIEYKSNLRGLVDHIDRASNTLLVLGQTVVVGESTVFNNVSSLADLALTDVVEVSGLPDSKGRIVAAYVERQGAFVQGVTPLRVLGAIAAVMPQAFTISALTIDYSAVLPQNLPDQRLASGQIVEVLGNQLPQGDVLKATQVRIVDTSLGASEGDFILWQGLIADAITPGTFSINGVIVMTNSQTRFQNGNAAALMQDARVQVEGRWSSGGIIATKVLFL